MLQRCAVVAGEAIAKVVERHAELPVAAGGREFAGARVERKIAPADRQGPGVGGGMPRVHDVAAAQSVRDINAAIQCQPRMIGPQLRILLGEAAKPGFARIGAAVAVAVRQIGNLARQRDEQSAFPGLNAGGKQQPVGEHARRFEAAVTVFVGEHAYLRARRFAGRGSVRIVAHLDDPQPARLVEANGDGSTTSGSQATSSIARPASS